MVWKLRNAAENLERHIELKMGLGRKVDKDRELINDKYGLIDKLETKTKNLEEWNIGGKLMLQSNENIDCMKVDMRSLVSKLDMVDNHALGEMQNLVSERQIK